MQRDAFVTTLASEGFPEPVVVDREPGAMNEHTHAFEAKALILEGEIHIRIGENEQLFKVGDVFHIPANTPHAERYGPGGVRYLAGRKT